MPPPCILYLALKSILVSRLQKILCCPEILWQSVELPGSTYVSNHTSPCTPLEPNQIIVNRIQKDTQLQYASAVALKFMSVGYQSATELAVEITDTLNRDIVSTAISTSRLPLDRVWQKFTVHTDSSGWIYLKLCAIGLHEWLNLLTYQLPNTIKNSQNFPKVSINWELNNIFPVLYTHARCCSLLRLGAQKQIIQLNQPDPDLAGWKITAPEVIDWLNIDRQFRCTHPAEHRLIGQIIDIFDELACTPTLTPQRLWKLTQDLSQVFQAFYASCQIFGAIGTDDRALAQARLGLVFITQALLNWILRDWLDISPPTEL